MTKSKTPESDDESEQWLEGEDYEEGISKTLESLEASSQQFDWMKESKHQQMFREIEGRLSGVLGKGLYEWVDRRVFDEVFDQSTLLSIYKLMQQDHIDTIEWPIARGKEAHVFHATAPSGPIAVKIFHTSNAVFKNMMRYIEGDPRFRGIRRNNRELMTLWVRKEHRNLKRMRKAGVRVPEPLALFRNVLVMEYLGDEEGPSPRLRDISVENVEEVFDSLIEQLRLIWRDAELVHADFSEYNILWHAGEPWIIDAGCAVAEGHPNDKEFLIRDVTNLVEWAKRNGHEVELSDAMMRILDD